MPRTNQSEEPTGTRSFPKQPEIQKNGYVCPQPKLLVINCGSSSIKFAVFSMQVHAARVTPTIVLARGKRRVGTSFKYSDGLLNETRSKAPLRRTVEACEVGRAALMLASDYANAVTGEVLHVDGGFHVEGMVFH